MNRKVVIIGAGNHAKVVIDIVLLCGDVVVGILDDNADKGLNVLGFPVIGNTQDAMRFNDCEFVIAIGANAVRRRIAETLDVHWYTAVHPSAVISSFAEIGEGCMICAGAVVNPCAKIGRHCIINTSSVIEHDNDIGDYVHLSPNAALGGTVRIGPETHIGIGASVKNGISICGGCVIGAGAAVVKNITEKGVYIGIPAAKT